MDWYKTTACLEIDKHSRDLFRLSRRIRQTSDSGKKEEKNIQRIVRLLKKNNFRVTLNPKGVPLTFRAEYGVSSSPSNKRANVAFLCRYDVAGKQSQFSGNNIVAEVAVAASLGVKAVLELSCPTVGKVTIIGYPDTASGRAATMVNLREFKDIDVVMMGVPGPRTDWCPKFMGRKTFRATYTGNDGNMEKCIAPTDEQSACIMAYQNVLAMQEHYGKKWQSKAAIERTCRPKQCRTLIYTEAPSNADLFLIEKRVIPCLEAAAQASGCKYDLDIAQKTYYSLINNKYLAYMMQLNAYFCGTLSTPSKSRPTMDPVDMANVSHVVPTLMPMFYIGTDAEIGSPDFKKALRSYDAHVYTVAIAKAFAMTAVDVLSSTTTLSRVKEELLQSLSEEKSTRFKPFSTQIPDPYAVKTELPTEGNIGWSRPM